MAATSVTPVAGLTSVITTGGDAVIAVPPGPNGGYITNPPDATDQGISEVEMLYIDPVEEPGLAAFGTTSGLAPGQSYALIPGSTNPVYVNAATNGHRFTVIWY
jgi:hypothetical protein